MTPSSAPRTPWPHRLLRVLRLIAHLILGSVLAALVLPSEPARMGPRALATIRWWHRRACRILGVRVEVRGSPPRHPVLVASPHLSWLDIPVLGGVMDCAFLSKQEVRHWPAVGWLAARAGTLFVRRGERQSAEDAVGAMTAALEAGRQVVFFPEGTTTSGELRRFRGRLFAAAQRTDVPVQPVALTYPDGAGGTEARVPFVGSAGFVRHVLALTGVRRITARVCFLERLPATAGSPAALAREAEGRVRAALPDCRVA